VEAERVFLAAMDVLNGQGIEDFFRQVNKSYQPLS
jgi:hypothetical protein